ncbi:MAG: DUF2490 domain-containing protein [Burkholderiales bacterium]|nr:DUF2490 domain-containing protein [Burkholderiales bacterium]
MQAVTFCCRLLVAALLAFAAPAGANETQQEFVPELNAYIKLSERSRAYLQAGATGRLTQGTSDGEIGAYLDYTLKPIYRLELREANWERDRYLWVRAGYGLGGSQEGLKDFNERRFVLEATGRMPLSNEVWLVHRGRVDLRSIDGESSQRYRYRLGIEREFNVKGVPLVPYAQAEAFYDTRFDALSRGLYQAGAEIELTKQWRIEPYYARQHDMRPASGSVNRLGLVLKYYR